MKKREIRMALVSLVFGLVLGFGIGLLKGSWMRDMKAHDLYSNGYDAGYAAAKAVYERHK